MKSADSITRSGANALVETSANTSRDERIDADNSPQPTVSDGYDAAGSPGSLERTQTTPNALKAPRSGGALEPPTLTRAQFVAQRPNDAQANELFDRLEQVDTYRDHDTVNLDDPKVRAEYEKLKQTLTRSQFIAERPNDPRASQHFAQLDRLDRDGYPNSVDLRNSKVRSMYAQLGGHIGTKTKGAGRTSAPIKNTSITSTPSLQQFATFNAGGQEITLRGISDYETPSWPDGFALTAEQRNLTKVRNSETRKNTDEEVLNQALVQWADDNPALMRSLNATSVYRLDAKQAYLFAMAVTTGSLKYPTRSELGVEAGKSINTAAADLDSQGVDDMVLGGLTGKEAGALCRHYGITFADVFNALRDLKAPSTGTASPSLRGAYAVDYSGGGHRCAAVLVMRPEGGIDAILADPTWSESSRAKSNPAAYNDALSTATYTTALDGSKTDPRPTRRYYFQLATLRKSGSEALDTFVDKYNGGFIAELANGDIEWTHIDDPQRFHREFESLPSCTQHLAYEKFSYKTRLRYNEWRGSQSLPQLPYNSDMLAPFFGSNGLANRKNQETSVYETHIEPLRD